MKKLLTVVSAGLIVVASASSAGMYLGQKEFHVNELECLALNVYHETRAMSLADAHAVSDVVLNRVESSRYPNTICEVVHQGYKKGNRSCQFSWYCDGKADPPANKQSVSWKLAEDVAYQILAFDKWNGMVEGATHYHADYVSPRWRKSMRLITKIDDHIFYREN